MAVQDDVEKADGIRPAQRPGPAATAAATAAATPAGTPERSGGIGRAGPTAGTDVLSAVAGDGLVELGPDGSDLDPTFRHSYSRDQAIVIRRLRRIEGQVRGIERMIERREYCIDILQQTAALRAAVDSVALLILEDHVQGCVRTAAEQGDADRYIEEVLDVVRRALGKPVRTPRV
jgi:DNA-binding FrmR family transcriptional regulator